VPSELTGPFWEACARGELVVQQCRSCSTRFFTPLPACPACRSLEWSWEPSPGTGTLYAFTEVHRAPSPDIAVPYVIGIVDLDDGWTMMTTIVGSLRAPSVRDDLPARDGERAPVGRGRRRARCAVADHLAWSG
jgi:uncharacterized OB-fold protein